MSTTAVSTRPGGTGPELVVLLDERGQPIGTAEKVSVHGPDTPLHLAFSCHLSNEAGELLVTRRSLGKRTWPGVWTNSFCGHPAPGESLTAAMERRGVQELGVRVRNARLILPDFRYRAVDASGVVENELCPVFRAVTSDPVRLDPAEAVEYRWVSEAALRRAVRDAPWAFSPWLTLQLPLLAASAAAAENGAV